MPQVVNGCGTWYYGKKNVAQYPGLCTACKSFTTLTSYDTRLFVVVVFIPVIPLGRKRIIEECAACRRHRVMPLPDWQRAQRRTEESIAAYRNSPEDAQLAEEALQACVGYRNVPAFMALAPEIEQHLAASAKTLCLLAAGYDLFGRIEDTERLLRAALEAEDTDDTREALGDCLLRQGRPDEAEACLEHIAQDGIPDRVDHLYHLAQGYQAKGEHEKALAVFEQCESINPQIAQDATFQRLREASTSRLGTHAAIKPGEVVRKAKRAAGLHRLARVGPVVLVLAALAYAALAWIQGLRREVFLVSGLGRPYTARLNGATYTLQPQEVKPVRLAEGEVEVEITDPPLPVEHSTVSIRTSFLTRPFSNQTFVINPDGVGILRRTRVFYARSGAGASPAQDSYTAGQVLHHFSGVDCPFKDFPDSLSTDSHSRQISRDGLFLATKGEQLAPSLLLVLLTNQLGKKTVIQLAQRHLLLEPDQDAYLGVLWQVMKPEDLAAFLRPGLDKRPLRVQWHRIYQSAMNKAGQEEQLEREYDAILAKEPQNKDLMYLDARASNDIDKSFSLCQKAAAGEPPSAFAMFWLCGYYLSNGQFPETARYAEQVLQLLPNEKEFGRHCRRSLLADDRFEKVLEMLKSEQNEQTPYCLAAYADEAYVRTILGQKAEARQAIERLRVRLGQWPKETADQQIRRVEALVQYAMGNPTQFQQLLQASSDPEDRFAAQLTGGDLAAAEKEVPQMEPTARLHLLLFLAATSLNQRELAERHLAPAVDLLAKGEFEDRAFATAIKGGASSVTKNLLRLFREPDEKAILLATVGLRDPAARGECFALARKLNFDKRFPHLLLKRVLDSRPAP